MDYEIIEITPDTWVKQGGKLERLVDVMSRPEDFYLWSVIWYVRSAEGLHHQNGISFHCKHGDALEYKSEHMSPIQVASKAMLVPVSEWLYNKVIQDGNYWTNLQYLNQARTYQGPTIN